MINMMPKVKEKFPDLYTKQGKLSKREPKKYKCDCGHLFSRLKTTANFGGMKFGSPICPKCEKKAKDNLSYYIWKRAINGQIEQEDFILNTVKEHGVIEKEELEKLILENFEKDNNALGNLVYFSYLRVDKEKRDELGIIEYTIHPNKSLDFRCEFVR